MQDIHAVDQHSAARSQSHLNWQVGYKPGVLVNLCHRDALIWVPHKHPCEQVTALRANLNACWDGPLQQQVHSTAHSWLVSAALRQQGRQIPIRRAACKSNQ